MRERDAVDRLLAGLGGAEPGAGMEDRMLRRLAAEREAAAGGRSWVRGWAVATVVCLVGAGLVVGHERRTPFATAAPDARHFKRFAAEPGNASGRTGSSVSRMVSGGVRDQEAGGADRAHVAPAPVPSRYRGLWVAETPERQRQRVGLAATGAIAVSFPAPPMPLTRQERLLLRMLASGQRTELVATQSAEAESAMAVRENTGRVAFFTPVRPAIGGERKEGGEDTTVDAVGHEGPAVKAVGDGHGTVKEKE